MKHIFVINPAAGKKDPTRLITDALKSYRKPLDYEVYITKSPLDASRYVNARCRLYPGAVRFYACGGDGTLNEVVNGAAGFPQAEVACYPCGSGDDFVKYYGGKEGFLDLASNIEGAAVFVDLMKINGRYAINVISFGFDSVVAKTISSVKRKPIIGGKNSYATGIVRALFVGMRNKCAVGVDGAAFNGRNMLLCTVANGSHVGGSFKCAPRAKNDDGLLEVCLVKPVSVFTFAKLINRYKKGEHLDDPRLGNIIKYKRGEEVVCGAESEKFCVSVDGEIVETRNFTIEVAPKALKFVIPKDVSHV